MKTSLKSISVIAIIAMISAATLSSCKKDETTPTIDGAAQKTAEDRTMSSSIEDANTSISEYVANIDPKSQGGRVEGTFLGTGQTSYNPLTRTFTIDFGTTNAVCSDGKRRKGKIFVRFTQGEPRLLDYNTTTTQDNYFVNDIKVEGTRTDAVKATIALNTITSTRDIVVTGRKLTFPDASTFSESGTYKTVAALKLLDRSWEITLTGNTTGTNRQSQAFTATISTPIKIVSTCDTTPPISGKIEIAVVALSDKITIDYGSGDCDRKATISYKGQSVVVNF